MLCSACPWWPGYSGSKEMRYLYQPFGCGPRLSHQETGAAILGVVPILVLHNQASVDTFLYLSLPLIGLVFGSRVGSPTYLLTYELGLQLDVHLY